ncbi:hypothetical protein GQ44DRAFT_95499 [Phaeosphaeriaceae sp. PMI808]|nr:hypothetical protein GQ44DRAFT_95499 [Phaeosphaeriaceae sp. PMI808]
MAGDTDNSRPPASSFIYSNRFGQLNPYALQLNYTTDCCFNQFESPIGIPYNYVATLKNSTSSTSRSRTEEWVNPNTEPIRQISQFEIDSFSTTTPHNTTHSPQNTWPNPSIGSDARTQVAPQEVQPHTSPSASSSLSLECDLLSSPQATTKERAQKHSVARKRGRPRLHRGDSSSYTLPKDPDKDHTYRIAHNQVERKYREGLNAGIEKLHRAVPALPQERGDAALGQARPSKLMVLASAVEYIKSIERERDAAIEELEYFKDACFSLSKGRGTNQQ